MIGSRLKQIRTYNDITQKNMGEILKVNRATYSGWENGFDSIPLNKLNDFCNFFNISLDYICELTCIENKNFKKIELNNLTIANNLKNIRKENKHTQDYTAKKIGITQSTYSKYELGKVFILTFNIIEFAKYYNVSIDYICGKTNNKNII